MTLELWLGGGAGGEGPLADVMDVRERLSQAPCGVNQRISSVDYVVGCSYSQGASSCCLLFLENWRPKTEHTSMS